MQLFKNKLSGGMFMTSSSFLQYCLTGISIGGIYALIAIGLGGLAVCFGAMMGAYPALVLDYFGPNYYSTNYAFIFLAYGIGGLIAANVATLSISRFGGYLMAFIIIGVSCAVGVVMSLISKPPAHAQPSESMNCQGEN